MPQSFQHDPDALATLLRGQTQIPRYTDEEYAINDMIPQEDLFQAQEAYGERGAASGRAYSVPSREALQQSGGAKLKQMFGMQRAKGQAEAYPIQIKGQYDLEGANVKARGDVESARQKAIADASQRSADQTFQQDQQGRQQTFQAEQGRLTREALTGRAGVAQASQQRGREYTQGQINSRVEAKKPFNPLAWLFGEDKPAAAPTAPAAPGAQGGFDVQDNITMMQQRHPGMGAAQLLQLLQQGKFLFDSPEEEAATEAALTGAR